MSMVPPPARAHTHTRKHTQCVCERERERESHRRLWKAGGLQPPNTVECNPARDTIACGLEGAGDIDASHAMMQAMMRVRTILIKLVERGVDLRVGGLHTEEDSHRFSEFRLVQVAALVAVPQLEEEGPGCRAVSGWIST